MAAHPSPLQQSNSTPSNQPEPVPEGSPATAADVGRAAATSPEVGRRSRPWQRTLVSLAVTTLLGSVLVVSLALAQTTGDTPQPTLVVSGSSRNSHSATLLSDGRVLVAGGWDGVSTVAGADIYDPGTQAWNPTAALSETRAFHAAALLPDGRVLVSGGWGNLGTPLTSAELYDPVHGVWTPGRDAACCPGRPCGRDPA